MERYHNRIIDQVLKDTLARSGAVLIEGPKWCGKTRTAKEFSKSVVELQNPNTALSYRKMASTKPSLILEGNTPRLIDEWQVLPNLWDAVRYEVDIRDQVGQFILTGSHSPKLSEITHTGTGRISRILMRPMSLYESNDSNGLVSLNDLFNQNHDIFSLSPLTVEAIAHCIVRGGWPKLINLKPGDAYKAVIDYVENLIELDITQLSNERKNPYRIRKLFHSLARNISTQASLATLVKDIDINAETIKERTLVKYIDTLRSLFIIEDLPAWSPSLRSKTPLRMHSKWHFIDPSIACATLRLTPKTLLSDFETFGYLFESLCIRDLRIYTQSLDGSVFHFRDKNGFEVDAILQLNDGRWAAIEIKLGLHEEDKAAQILLRFQEKNPTKASFLMILSGSELAYQRSDGVLVVPLACLKN